MFFPLAAAGVYPKTRVWGSKPENVHCTRATAPLKIELRWGCEESREKTAVGSGVSFKYDPFGRRIEKISPTTTSIFVYDGPNLIETVNSTGGVVARYAQTQNVDEPLAESRSGTTSYYEQDGLGSVTSLSNTSGALAQSYTYDSFGNQTASSGSLTNFFRYTGREFDTETGLYFNRARYLDPTTGRFISEDPFKEVLRGLNFYTYVRNDPVGYTDPNGKSPWDWWDKLWGWLGFGKTAWNAASSTMDWSLCGLYYVDCLNQGMGIKKEIAQALNSPDPVVYATALATLAQQTGSNSMSQLNVNVCMNNENCQKALQCEQKGLTNPLPFPVNIPVNH